MPNKLRAYSSFFRWWNKKIYPSLDREGYNGRLLHCWESKLVELVGQSHFESLWMANFVPPFCVWLIDVINFYILFNLDFKCESYKIWRSKNSKLIVLSQFWSRAMFFCYASFKKGEGISWRPKSIELAGHTGLIGPKFESLKMANFVPTL
jgi:hypothetical protein